jgi:ATP/maltotriose-dependent transcriptional regulator MalT
MTTPSDHGQIRLAIEAVHHACAAGDFDAAAAVLYNRVYKGPEAYFAYVLGGYETTLETLTDFFPLRDLSLDPQLVNPEARRWILHETAVCLHVLGQLRLAVEVGARAVTASLASNDRHNAAISLHNLAETHLAAGALGSCRSVAVEALRLADEAGEMEDQLVAYTLFGHLDYLSRRQEEAGENFRKALEIALAYTSVPLLYSLSGIRYADYLIAAGRESEAVAVITANLDFCRSQGWQSDVALVLAQQARVADVSYRQALEQIDGAVRAARTIGAKQTLAESLLARAQIAQRAGADEIVYTDLTEVLSQALVAGYRLIEVDARTLLAAHARRHGDRASAEANQELARDLSRNLGYEIGYWRATSSASTE